MTSPRSAGSSASRASRSPGRFARVTSCGSGASGGPGVTRGRSTPSPPSTASASRRPCSSTRSSGWRRAPVLRGRPNGSASSSASSSRRHSRWRREAAPRRRPAASMSDPAPRQVLVTGGGRGIGRAIALRFAESGAHVFVNFFVNREAAEKTARDVELRGGTAQLLQADLKEPEELRKLMAEVERRAGRLDVLVSNAASGVLRSGLELSPRQWDWVLATNARALLVLAQDAARLMTAGGRIIALSSLGSQRVIPGYTAIGVSKAALEALTRYLAAELAPKRITVNTVSAGAVGTDVWQAMPDGGAALAAIRERTPGGALVTPEEVADVVFFLATPAAQAIAGQVLTVDGGYSLLA